MTPEEFGREWNKHINTCRKMGVVIPQELAYGEGVICWDKYKSSDIDQFKLACSIIEDKMGVLNS